jgi:hypothetical protein
VKIDARNIEVIEDEIAAALRLMGPERRLAMMFQAEAFARTLMRAGAKFRHPDWTEAEVEREIARLWADGSV